MEQEAEMKEAEEVISVMESLSSIHKTEEDIGIVRQVTENVRSLIDACEAHQKQVHLIIQGLHEKVKSKEQRLLNAQKAKLKDEELQELKDDLAQARVEEDKARATAISMAEHLDGLADQLQSVESQKQTLASLANEEVRLKNELSLFSTISGIIPDLSKTEVFAGSIQSFSVFMVLLCQSPFQKVDKHELQKLRARRRSSACWVVCLQSLFWAKFKNFIKLVNIRTNSSNG